MHLVHSLLQIQFTATLHLLKSCCSERARDVPAVNGCDCSMLHLLPVQIPTLRIAQNGNMTKNVKNLRLEPSGLRND